MANAYEIPGNRVGTLTASADLSTKQYFFGKVVSGSQVTTASVVGELVAGVIYNAPASGEPVVLLTSGVAMVQAGAAVIAGEAVMADANGAAIQATTGKYARGIALSDAAGAGEIITVDITNNVGLMA